MQNLPKFNIPFSEDATLHSLGAVSRRTKLLVGRSEARKFKRCAPEHPRTGRHPVLKATDSTVTLLGLPEATSEGGLDCLSCLPTSML